MRSKPCFDNGNALSQLDAPFSEASWLVGRQASYLLPIHPSIIDCYKELNTVIETKQTSEVDNYTSKKFWCATPENCGDPSTLNGIQKTIYDTIKRFKQLELLDPTINQENKKQLLEKINWSGSIFTKLERLACRKKLMTCL